LWEPHNGIKGPKCVLGHDITYRRRIRNATCFTEDGLNQIVSIENCPCENRDYECDYDYEKTSISGICAYQGTSISMSNSFTEAQVQCASEDYYTISSGYRKVPGDTCSGDIPEFAPIVQNCTKSLDMMLISGAGSGRNLPLIIGISVGCLILAGIGGFCLGLRNERFRSKFAWVKAPAWVHIGYSNQLVEETDGDEEFVANKPETNIEQDPETNIEQDTNKVDETPVDLDESE